MWRDASIVLLTLHNLVLVSCPYPPIGDEVQPGSVLLPATRRGRYLANIVRRQAVDGTGIKFNKDADRMNAESKKKVDVLSEELLPYIIAEQERRTTLYKRVMTAIQNGEKGVTIAEIRSKPPAIIRKGLMYRCPTNRAPREPDGSGIIMCEENIEPSAIMFESCLSAEDKELYVADNKFFFCNRHKTEGPDLPRNGTTVIGCSPCERTSLNYTSQKCALEDTDDVVVHYRYYPDRTYKFVTELDPDREVCEHWNPCQVGYIFSLPSPDQATPASELWRDYYTDEEIVPPIPEDDKNETWYPGGDYISSTRRLSIPDGLSFDGIGRYKPDGTMTRITQYPNGVDPAFARIHKNLQVKEEVVGKTAKITMEFSPLLPTDATSYYARFKEMAQGRQGGQKKFVFIPMVTISMGVKRLDAQTIEVLPGQRLNQTVINFRSQNAVVTGIMLRSDDGSIRNIDIDKYRIRKYIDDAGIEMAYLELGFEEVSPHMFGDYFLMTQNDDGQDERIKMLTIKAPTINVVPVKASASPGEHLDQTLTYACDDCELTDVVCRGESILNAGRITLIPTSKTVNINFPGFEDANACVYEGIFTKGGVKIRKILAVLENNSIDVEMPTLIAPPEEGTQFEQPVRYTCTGGKDCTIAKVFANGITLGTNSRRSAGAGDVGSVAFYVIEDGMIKVRITEYSSAFEGVYQATFILDGGEQVTKSVMEIGIAPGSPPESTTENEEENVEDDGNSESGSTTEPGNEAPTDPGAEPPTDPPADTTPEPPPQRRHFATVKPNQTKTPKPTVETTTNDIKVTRKKGT